MVKERDVTLTVEWGAGSETYDFASCRVVMQEGGAMRRTPIWRCLIPARYVVDYGHGYRSRDRYHEDLEKGQCSMEEMHRRTGAELCKAWAWRLLWAIFNPATCCVAYFAYVRCTHG